MQIWVVTINKAINNTKEELTMAEENFISYLAGENETEYQSLYTFAVDTLTFANKIHIYHWSCDSGFHHTHFQTIYETLRDFADSLVEIVLGTGTEFKLDQKSYMFSDEIFNIENALRKLRTYIDELTKRAEQFQSKIAINNLMSDTIEKLEGEYGLISRFK